MDALEQILTRFKRRDPAVLASVASVAALAVVLKWASTSSKQERKFVTDFAEIASKDGKLAASEYDVVVVGGGTAGCVIASRLSEDPSVKVLLLEAGQSGAKNPYALIPSAYSRFWLGEHEWNLFTEPQVHANQRKIFWPRGKLLGGCSNMNAMMYHNGAPTDYDEWAAMQKDQPGGSEWSYKEFHKYFHKFEKYNPSHEFPNVDASLRSSKGFVDVGYTGYFGPYSRDFINACRAAGIEASHDVNTHKGTLGVTKMMTYIDQKGQRMTSERAYLTPEVLARPNLKVATGAFVTRILFDTTQKAPRATGVEFQDKTGATFVARAAKEVVLAAGAVHTPHILMLSGVGPADHLASVGIPVVADLPVGSGLKDHIVIDLSYLDKHKDTLSFLKPTSFSSQVKFTAALIQYQLTGKGPMATNVAEAAAFVRSDDEALFPPGKYPADTLPEDTSTGPGAPDIEIYLTGVAYKDHGLSEHPQRGAPLFMTHTVCLRPKSTGTIRLRSKNPRDPPVIDPRYLEDYNDVKSLVRGMLLLDDVARKEPLASRIDPAGDSLPGLEHDLSKWTPAELEQFVRANVQTLYHPACTARMAPLEDGGVIDPLLRVHGIPNLRVADASSYPSIVSGHTTGPVYAIAEKAADLIKRDVGQRATRA